MENKFLIRIVVIAGIIMVIGYFIGYKKGYKDAQINTQKAISSANPFSQAKTNPLSGIKVNPFR